MPTYEYVCEACSHEFEQFQSIKDDPLKKCPQCKKSKVRRKISAGGGFLFKGSGFYITDYRSDSYKESAKKDSDSTSSASSSESKSDSKPAASKAETPAKKPEKSKPKKASKP